MGSRRLAVVLGLAVAVGGFVLVLRARDRQAVLAAAPAIGVDQLAKDPAAYTDRDLTLEGVVAATLPEQRLFTVIDRAEYQACRVVTCSQYQIPIAFAGPLPPVEQPVSVTGRLVQPEPGRFLLQASRIERLP